MVMAARRLRPYFQAHPIKVLTDQPLRRILHSPETSGRLIQWSIELGEFDIEYKPRVAIKAQVLADFLVEYTYLELEELPKEKATPWVLQVDGSTTKDASGAGLILTSPKGQRLSYALRFEFKTTNNEAEYEALVVGLELTRAVEASHVLAKSDSQLVVGQILGEYTIKEEVMQKYANKVKAQIAKLQSFNIVRIPREENSDADYLAKLAMAKEDAIPRNTPVRYLELPSIASTIIQVQAINYSDSWTGPIVDYITNGTLPEDKIKARQLKIRAAKYLMMGDVLYRRSFSLPYLRGVLGNRIFLRPSSRLPLIRVNEKLQMWGSCPQVYEWYEGLPQDAKDAVALAGFELLILGFHLLKSAGVSEGGSTRAGDGGAGIDDGGEGQRISVPIPEHFRPSSSRPASKRGHGL
ncbi:hypothetical protein RHSIM_Rhsim09G0074100 [Rhododendron simsii]|uniref:RNase H type-1 domain-containing protein n=1 Tax=Rhododendron simsii TaxID=118357 RepID=A0A834GG15_RHOSS|nr:hypothetical protein RHSIM_Rhsim09G0074100 [Rhododendron simsii]